MNRKLCIPSKTINYIPVRHAVFKIISEFLFEKYLQIAVYSAWLE